jgi:hypothetical protein
MRPPSRRESMGIAAGTSLRSLSHIAPTVRANCCGIFMTVAMRGGLMEGLAGVQWQVPLEMGSNDTSTYPGSGPSSLEVKSLCPACSLLWAHGGYNAPWAVFLEIDEDLIRSLYAKGPGGRWRRLRGWRHLDLRPLAFLFGTCRLLQSFG